MTKLTRGIVAVGLWCGASIALAQDDTKALLERACTQCHEITAATGQRNTKDRWAEIVDDMVDRGAEISDSQIEQIIGYLAKNYGPKVNVNKAGAEQIAAALEIPQPTATAIVDHRTKNGPFKGIEDLKKVAGVNAKLIENAKNRVEF
jgi:competence protein ComEA